MSTGKRSAGNAAIAAAPVFAALGDETRLRLVARLCEGGPQSIAALADGSDVTRQAITKHLQVLADAGLARSAREGRESVWEFEPRRLAEIRRCLDTISKQWDAALVRLEESRRRVSFSLASMVSSEVDAQMGDAHEPCADARAGVLVQTRELRGHCLP